MVGLEARCKWGVAYMWCMHDLYWDVHVVEFESCDEGIYM